MTTIEARIANPTSVNVTMNITMTLSGWLRLMDELENVMKSSSREKNDYTQKLIDAINQYAERLQDKDTLYFSKGMATASMEPNKEEKVYDPGN